MVDQVIKLKRNTANTNAPDTGDIVVGELAIGAVAGKLYLRKSDDSILTFSDDSNVSTTLTIAADSGSNDTVTVGTNTLTFNGTSNQIGTTVSDNAITIALSDDPVIGGTGSIRVPDGTTGQRPGSPAAGMFRYNTTTSKFEGYTDDWGDIGGGGANTFTRNAYTGDGSTTAFTLSQTVNSENDLIVFIEGVFQDQDAYSVSGTTLTFDTAPVNGRGIIVYSVKHTVAGSNLNIDTMTGDGSDTTLSLTISPNDENNTQVFIDGVYQNKSTYSISGSTLTFSTAPPNGSAVECMTFTQTDVNEATYVTANANNSTNETVYPVFVDGATGKQEIETDTGLTYNPSTGNLTIGGELSAATLDISGDIDIDGTLEADAITVNGTTLAETIADTVGAMVSSNTESGITVAYQDADNTLDFTVGTLNQDTTGTAAIATTVTITDNESTNEENAVIFTAGGDVDGGNLGLESDGNLTYNPSSGTLTATAFAGALTGNVTGNVTGNASGTAATVTGAAQSNITSLGTLTTLTVDNVIINGTTIGHTSDTDLMTLADGVLTVAGELDATSLDISGDADIDGTLETDNLTVGGAQGSDGQVLTSTGSGVGWETPSSFNADAAQVFNESGAAVDFRIEGDTDANLFFLDGSADKIGIGTSSPATTLHVLQDSAKIQLESNGSDTGVQLILDGARTSNGTVGDIVFENAHDTVAMIRAERVGGNDDAADMSFYTQVTGGSNAEKMRIDSNGNVGIGITTPNESGFGATSNVLSIAGTAQDAFGVLELISTDVTASNRIGEIRFGNLDGGSSFASNAGIRATRNGADNTSNLSLWTTNAGTFAEKLTIGHTGPLVTVTDDGTDGYETLLKLYRSDSSANEVGFQFDLSGSGGAGQAVGIYAAKGEDWSSGTSRSATLNFQAKDDGTDQNMYQFGNFSDGVNQHKFLTEGAERMRIDQNGVVMVGDTAVYSGGHDAVSRMQLSGGGSVLAIRQTQVTDASHRVVQVFTDNGGTYRGRITINNSSCSFTAASDYRLKENIETLPNGLDRLKQLKPVKFKWKEHDYTSEGFIAHEVQEIYPDAVVGAKDDAVMQSMDYGKITPLLVKAIQEQQTIIDDLKARIETLEG